MRRTARLGRSSRVTAAVLAVVMLGSGGTALAAPVTPGSNWSVPPGQKEKSVPVSPVAARKLPAIANGTPPVVAPVWPAATDTDVDLAPAARQVRAAGSPVRLDRVAAKPAKVHVKVADHKAAEALGLDGVVLSVTGATDGPVKVALDYSGFANAFGGGWSDRLRLFTLPACALSTPDKPQCRERTPIAGSTNDAKTRQVTADVTTGAQQTQVLAAAAASSGSAGSTTAMPLSAAGDWSAGGSGGDFSYSYPFATPKAPNGAAPNLALSYSSGSIDGLTSATNNQASWIGDGWDFTPGGFIERHYKGCSEDLGGNNGQTKTGDQCWGPDNASLVLGGRSTQLIKVSDTLWRPKSDDGSKVELLTGAQNGVSHGQHWRVTTGDGTQYYFGLNHLPGWTTGKPETQSAWTVPVFGNNDGEDCYQANDFAHSWCQQAWRWNLDYSVDPHGNVSSYYYQPEKNSYGLNLNVTSAGTSYVAGGYPLRVEYGLRLVNGSVYGTSPSNQVVFDTAERCIPDASFDCAPDKLTAANAAHWPDVPFDQICAEGATCDYGAPAFFTRKRLTAVRTQYLTGTTPHDIDQWDLVQSYPGSGDAAPPAPWLNSITHTGKAGATPITLPPTLFDRYVFANRVDTLNDQYAAITRSRLKEIRTETGGRITVAYSAQDCVPGVKMPASPETDTYRCFASYWSPPASKDPVLDWFHKYVVVDVKEEDLTGGSVPVETHYDYPIDTAAWHYDDSQFTPDDRRTWNQWRGYNVVTTSIGAPGKTQTVTESLYLRGMDGDHLPSGTRQVSVTDSDGGSIVDEDFLQGFVRESRTKLEDGKTVDSATVNEPWKRGPTATSADGRLKAYMLDTKEVRGRTLLSDGKTYRRTLVKKQFDDNGMTTQVEDQGDTSTPSDDTCTNTTYVANTAGMFDRSSSVVMFGGTCAGTQTAANSITDVKVAYDHQAVGQPPTKGDITEQDTLDTWDADGKHYVATAKNSYDDLGRETESTDVFGNVSKTAFVPETGGPVTQTKTTNPLGWTSTTTLEPARGNPTTSVDVNGVSTDIDYDALGRKTTVWKPGRLRSQTASATFEYGGNQTTPTFVRTKTLQDTGKYTDAYTIYDGLGRTRQTQVPAQGGGRIIADTLYDSRGLQFKTNAPYYNDASGPNATLVSAADNTVMSQTVTEYDRRARPTASILMSKGVEQWRTTTRYEGERTTTIPPAGGSPSTVVTDAQGQTAQRLQYTNGYTPGAANPADVTNYTYNAAGAMTSVQDSSGNVWSTKYDLRGRKIEQNDPDAGRSTFAYDQAGQLKSTTDARSQTLVYTYDTLGRKVRENKDSDTGPVLAAWTYDTVLHGLGLPASSTRWDGTDAYTNRVVTYDAFSRPTKTAVDVPASQDALKGTFEFSTKYTATGAVAETVSPAAGNLHQEHIVRSYTDLGLPSTTYALDSTTGARTDLVSSTGYTSLNEMSTLQLDSATSAANVGVTQTYDEVTRRAQTTTVSRETQVGAELTKRTYTYDPAGNVRKIADTPSGATADVQCFDYDYLQRMTEAWTPSSADCSTAKSATALGGAAPYWKSYTFDKTGNRKTQVEHKTAGDVTTTYTYPASGATAVRPHALTQTDTAGPTGTATAGYTYDETGSVKTRNVGGDTQTYTYDAEGRTATASDKTGTSSYVYDADGNRLITRDPTGVTLTIGDLEVFQTAGTHASTAIRYYAHGGTQVAERVGTSGLRWMLGDLHGTNGLSITQGTLQPNQRYTDPFGNVRAQTSTWPDKHGFVGGYQDTTGLTHLGARDYDPVTGRFTKVDPVLTPDLPQTLNAYAYANNSPATESDPSGLSACYSMGSDGLLCNPGTPQAVGCSWNKSCNVVGHHTDAEIDAHNGKGARDRYLAEHNVDQAAYRDAQAVVKKSKWDVFVDAAGELIKGLIGWDDIKDCVTLGAFGACVRTVINFIPWGKILKAGEIIADFWKGAKALITFGKEVEKAEKVIVDTEKVLVDAERAADAAADAERAASEVAHGAQEAKGAEAAGAAESSAKDVAPGCLKHSFVAGTRILLSDGTSKPIEQVHDGDVVQSTDPATGTVEQHRVVGTLVHTDEYERTEITFESGGSLVATDWHPVWLEEVGDWVPVGSLEPGDHLRSAKGAGVAVKAVRHFRHDAPVYDLTVDSVHSYYVLAGAVSLLVHNCGEGYERPAGKFVDKESRIARATGHSVRDIKDAIHSVKRQGKLGGARSNPDVMVDLETGEVHTKLPCGCPSEDSIGNIFDHLPDPDDYGGRSMPRGRR
ncbi:RHS repeat-associated core domain-containing protein [Amycolatopsis nalaikhensis]|uniref:RHS repeat-associated core domain-containing protein n=1 Tax=Amycolatopsis nalaikhensis TaxID=715472 RepID=A0ABY8XZA0_9PSEU|nr:RHS repeat-associated core domain-containing protein [Amycolatopsis sp. 2-2]WIV60944.1 RHS repeat-associated core domain-containing protein [Amycolatopsis sp. 2-2]